MNKLIIAVLVFVCLCLISGSAVASDFAVQADITISYKPNGAIIIRDSVTLHVKYVLLPARVPKLVTLGHTCISFTSYFVPTPGCNTPITTGSALYASRTAHKINTYVYTLTTGRQIKIIHEVTIFNGGGRYTVNSRCEMDSISIANYNCNLSVLAFNP